MCLVQDAFKMVACKAGATATWRYDVAVFPEIVQKFFCHLAGFFPVAGIKSRLSATGLVGIISYLAACTFEYLGHVQAGIGKKLVNEAGDEELDVWHGEVGWVKV